MGGALPQLAGPTPRRGKAGLRPAPRARVCVSRPPAARLRLLLGGTAARSSAPLSPLPGSARAAAASMDARRVLVRDGRGILGVAARWVLGAG